MRISDFMIRGVGGQERSTRVSTFTRPTDLRFPNYDPCNRSRLFVLEECSIDLLDHVGTLNNNAHIEFHTERSEALTVN